jgi:Tfp pilus assembly protein PilX
MKHRASHLIPSQQSERGFAIPIALGMGLIGLLLGVTSIVRSQDDRTTAMNKIETSRSLSAAEAGVTQIQRFLNSNRALANFNATGVTGTTVWSNSNAYCGTTTATAISNLTSDTWQDISTPTDTALSGQSPQYKLVKYTTGSSGELTVKGRTNGAKAIESESEITVRFPIFNPEDKLAASLWTKENITGNPTVQSDVIISCTSDAVATVSGDRLIIRANSQAMPPIPDSTYPTEAERRPTDTSKIRSLTSLTGKTLPESGDPSIDPDTTKADDEIYHYAVSSIDGSFAVQGGKQVRIWVAGDIDLKGKNVVNLCGLLIPDACNPFDVKVYGTSASSSAKISLNAGTAACDIHFYAPTYAVEVSTGGTTTQLCDNNTTSTTPNRNSSIYWVKSWSGDTTLFAPRAIWKHANIGLDRLPPRLGPVENWKPKEAS